MADFFLMNVSKEQNQCARRQPLRCPVGLCVQYVHLSKWATYAIVCVSATMARRVMSHGLVRQGDVRMRLRCCGATCGCVYAAMARRATAFTPLACNVWVRSRPWRATSECVHALGVQRCDSEIAAEGNKKNCDSDLNIDKEFRFYNFCLNVKTSTHVAQFLAHASQNFR